MIVGSRQQLADRIYLIPSTVGLMLAGELPSDNRGPQILFCITETLPVPRQSPEPPAHQSASVHDESVDCFVSQPTMPLKRTETLRQPTGPNTYKADRVIRNTRATPRRESVKADSVTLPVRTVHAPQTSGSGWRYTPVSSRGATAPSDSDPFMGFEQADTNAQWICCINSRLIRRRMDQLSCFALEMQNQFSSDST